MKMLGITAAAHNIGVAFVEDGKCRAQFSISGKEVHSEDLVQLIERISTESGISLGDLGGIAVAEGPGSYGGLRGSVTTAKTLAQVNNIPVVGIPTLEAIAFSLRHINGTILILLNACRSDFNAALFAGRDGDPSIPPAAGLGTGTERLTEDMIIGEERIVELLRQVSGQLYIACDRQLAVPTGAIFLSIEGIDPIGVALLGEKKIAAGETDELLELTPVYSHNPKFKEHKWS